LFKEGAAQQGTKKGGLMSRFVKRDTLAKPLIIIQFTISIVVIICSIVLNAQNRFLFSKNLGDNKDNIVLLHRDFWSEEPNALLLKEFVSSNPDVKKYCSAMSEPSYLNKDARKVKSSLIEGGFFDYTVTIESCDETLFELFNIPFVAGRTMRPYQAGQKFEEYVLNESAVRKLGFDNPNDIIGADFTIKPFFEGIIHGGKVVGVVKDFNSASLYHPIRPTVFFQKPIWQWKILLQLADGNRREQLKSIEEDWNKAYPEFPFEYQFLSDIYSEAYKKDRMVNSLLNLFSILCIIISVIGLWGISSIIISHRIKEIGIRKTNGARIFEIVILLNKSFIIWITLALILASPIAWVLSNNWLENYAYRIDVQWWYFVFAGLLTMIIALLTISIQTWQVASRNPVESLRYE
jgi:putative ABC transport system permease protein